MKFVFHEKALPTNLDCLYLIIKGLIKYVGFNYWLQRKNDIYSLKRCLKDFKIKNH